MTSFSTLKHVDHPLEHQGARQDDVGPLGVEAWRPCAARATVRALASGPRPPDVVGVELVAVPGLGRLAGATCTIWATAWTVPELADGDVETVARRSRGERATAPSVRSAGTS